MCLHVCVYRHSHREVPMTHCTRTRLSDAVCHNYITRHNWNLKRARHPIMYVYKHAHAHVYTLAQYVYVRLHVHTHVYTHIWSRQIQPPSVYAHRCVRARAHVCACVRADLEEGLVLEHVLHTFVESLYPPGSRADMSKQVSRHSSKHVDTHEH